MSRPGTRLTTGQDRGRLSPCVCNTLRMVSRAVTQLYDDVLRSSGLMTRSLNLLERDGVIERVPHPEARIKAMTLTSRGRRTLEAARPLWARAQDKVLWEVGTTAWADAQPRLAYLLRVAVKKRRPIPGRSHVQPSPARGGRGLVAG